MGNELSEAFIIRRHAVAALRISWMLILHKVLQQFEAVVLRTIWPEDDVLVQNQWRVLGHLSS